MEGAQVQVKLNVIATFMVEQGLFWIFVIHTGKETEYMKITPNWKHYHCFYGMC